MIFFSLFKKTSFVNQPQQPTGEKLSNALKQCQQKNNGRLPNRRRRTGQTIFVHRRLNSSTRQDYWDNLGRDMKLALKGYVQD